MLYVCCLLVLVLVVLNQWWFRDKVKLYNIFKTDVRAWPFIGHALWFLGTNEDLMNTFMMAGGEALKNGGIAAFWMAHELYLVVADPSVAELVLKTTAEKNEIMRFIKILTGNGILFAPASIWRPRRKILAPTFSQKNLNHFRTIFAKQSQIMVENLEAIAGKGTFPIWNYVTCCTMDSVCETIIGYKMDAQNNPDTPFFQAFEKCCRLVVERMVQPWFYNHFIYRLTSAHNEFYASVNYMHNFIVKIVKEKREELSQRNDKKDINDNEVFESRPKPFLELLIESSGGDRGYSDLELREETLVLLLGGTDTSAVGICFTFLMLAKHQDVQEKVYQELFEVFGESDRPIENDDILRLKYLQAVLKETMRLYPPVPILIPRLDRDITLPSGVRLPSDTGIVLNIWAMHHSPQCWGDDVEEFKPERFIDAEPNPAYMAFSTGLRSCLGYKYAMMSTTIIVSTMLRRYKLLPAENSNEALRLRYQVMMKDSDDYKLQIVSRRPSLS